jgi:predicted glycosyltransferase involved in capsule biosynthesis
MHTEPVAVQQGEEAVTRDRARPQQMRDYRDYHKNEAILVCGCGASLSEVVSPESFVTIGVNDVGRLFHPDYLVVLNPRSQFSGDRFKYVENSQAGAIFTQLSLGISHPHIVRFRLGQRSGVDLTDPDALPYTRNSPYVAVCLAVHMGARRIGLIGVDFTNDHFFARTGPHPLAREFSQIDREYKQLYEACLARGVEVFNLSDQSRLTGLPKMSFGEFAALKKQKKALRVVSYSVTPVAGVPIILSQCISAYTSHECHTVWASNSYGNGVSFDSDVEWQQAPSRAEELLESADLVIVHNGKVNPRHKKFFPGKPVITMAHNYMWNVNPAFVQEQYPGVVVGQYQATLPEFQDWQIVPNPLPLWDSVQPGFKNSEITICYTPSGKHERYREDHRLYWHSKGYATTMRVLNSLARRFGIRVETIGGGQVSLAESLAMKRRSHIVIDECVTGSYHRNSLEGLAAGCVVVNAVGHLPAVANVLRHCSGSDRIPFEYATLETLESLLEELIQRGAETLVREGASNRAWMEKYWDFKKQWGRFWEPAVDMALYRARTGRPAAFAERRETNAGGGRHGMHPGMHPGTHPTEANRPLSAVICHGGEERLRQLACCLANLRQCKSVNEIIVVDLSPQPIAEEISRRWADKYLFIKHDRPFERARALNLGAAVAQHDLVLWMDNDLIISADFVSKAAEEMERRELDFLIPYTQIRYQSESDSDAIMKGVRSPIDCPATRVLTALRGASGGAGLVKKSFIDRYGGMSEEFRGWGGEDDAWWHKAKLLGKAAITQQREQIVYHLYHINSGSFEKQKNSNPDYSLNVAVLRETWSIRNRDAFLKRFPPPNRASWGWDDKRIVLVSDDAGPESQHVLVAQHLAELASVQIDSCIARDGEHSVSDFIAQSPPDAIVIFGTDLAIRFLGGEANKAFWPRTIVIYAGGEMAEASVQTIRRAGGILAPQDSDAIALQEAALRPWAITGGASSSISPALTIALTLLQPLSIILGGGTSSSAVASEPGDETQTNISGGRESRPGLPVWIYWEGDCPEWIRLCRQTIFSHAPSVRLLSPDDFNQLRDIDRDIDLTNLLVAHRADYIRAFLLARYGGLWIDSDCIVMKSLDLILEMVEQYDFIAHKERSGLVSNGFIGSRPGGEIASEFYRRICSVLRSRKQLGWTSLGSGPLSEILRTTRVPWFEIQCQRIQPICWSNSRAFFTIGNSEAHAESFDDRALCYMLSNVEIRKLHAAATMDLLAEGTFFNYAIKRSLQNASHQDDGGKAGSHRDWPLRPLVQPNELGVPRPVKEVFSEIAASNRRNGGESVSGPGSALLHTEEIRQRLPLLIQDIGARSLLDAACGDFNWMKQVRLGIDQYFGLDVVEELITEDEKRFGTPTRKFACSDIAGHPLPQVDLILCRDCLVLLSYEDIFRALKNFKKSKSKYLLTTTFEEHPDNKDSHSGHWRPLNFRSFPFQFPEPLRVINEKCKEAQSSYSDKSLALWRIADIPIVEGINNAVIVTGDSDAKPAQTVECDLQKPVAADTGSAYELAVIVPISVGKNQTARLRNLKACLQALNSQDLERHRYRIVVVEQDLEERLRSVVDGLADHYIFAYNPGSFNKGWAFNVGASATGPAGCALCLMDADMLPGRAFLGAGLGSMQSGQRALRPYARVLYLDSSSTEQAIRERMAGPPTAFQENKYRGHAMEHSRGGCLWVDPQLYAFLNGFDERFQGFGYEDTEFWDRLSKHTQIKVLPGSLLHMDHPRTVERTCAAANAKHYQQVTSGRVAAWSGPMGDLHLYSDRQQRAAGTVSDLNTLQEASFTNGKRRSANPTMVEVFARRAVQCTRAGLESVSGPGSSLTQTAEIRRCLPSLIQEIGARSLLDAPCGDFNWMSQVALTIDDYFGVDLLPLVVEQNQKRFGGTGRKFMELDITTDGLPQADLVLCRDCLVHFSYEQIFRALKNFKDSRSEYLLMTTFAGRQSNSDIVTGDWRPLNFRISPFNLPEPFKVINEKCTEEGGRYADKSLALWRLADVAL